MRGSSPCRRRTVSGELVLRSNQAAPEGIAPAISSASASTSRGPGSDVNSSSQPPAASADPNAPVLEVGTAGVLEYDTHELSVAADTGFVIHFDNTDEGQLHDVDIRETGGSTIRDGEPKITGPAEANYSYEALEAGSYEFFCSVHPIPAMTGVLTVE